MAEHMGWWTRRLVGATLIMNVADATATVLLLHHKLIIEANPILHWAYVQGGAVGLVMMKAILVAGGSLILWTAKERPLALAGGYVCFVTYWSLLLWFWINLTRQW